MKNFPVVCEIGCNHMGKIDLAKDLALSASQCGASVIKFQKRNNKELLSKEEYEAPHPVPENSYGKTYGEHREFLEFDLSQHALLKEYIESLNCIYSTSVWDLTSAKEITELEPALIKIPSATNLKFEIYDFLVKNYKGEIHVSMGMTKKSEIDEIINFFIDKNRAQDLVIYSCTSGYPVPFDDVCLLEIKNLIDKYSGKVKKIGFSGHHLGIAVDVAAMTLGAEIVERHFTLDRTWKGTDHAASLEPTGFKKLVRDLTNVSKTLNFKSKDILDIEEVQRRKLKSS